MVCGGQCGSIILVILTLLGDNRGAPSGWRIMHSNDNNNYARKNLFTRIVLHLIESYHRGVIVYQCSGFVIMVVSRSSIFKDLSSSLAKQS